MNSFKLCVDVKFKYTIMETDFWPEEIPCRKYFKLRNNNNNILLFTRDMAFSINVGLLTNNSSEFLFTVKSGIDAESEIIRQ